MAVDTPDLKIDPYQSQVPLIQLPPEQITQQQPAQPLQGQFGGGHGTGALAIGDSILKGVLKGHAYKEEKKYKQAEATIAAADQATKSAYANYQDALTQGKDGDSVKALYDSYVQTFNQGKAAKAQFALPDEKQKKAQQKGGVKGKMEQFGGGIKEFFEANPHIVPQIALMTMRPEPPGPSLETQATKLKLDAAKRADTEGQIELSDAQRTQTAKKTYDLYSGLSQEELAALPRETQQQFATAKNTLYPPKESGTPKLYASEDGNQVKWIVPGQEPQGWNAVETGSGTHPGTFGFYLEQFAKKNGKRTDQLTPDAIDYARKKWAWDTQNGSTTTSTRWVIDDKGNYTALPSTTVKRQGAPPTPPPGLQGIDFFQPQQGGASGGTGDNFVTPSMAGKKVPGMVAPGNVDLSTRPNIDNGDGTHSSVFSKSFGVDGKEVLVPGVGDGKTYPLRQLTDAEALDQYKKTGKSLGTFETPAQATAYAHTLHLDQQSGKRSSSRLSAPPTPPASRAAGLSAPPTGGKVVHAFTGATNTEHVETEKANRYQKAEDKYRKALAVNQAAFTKGTLDDAGLKTANVQAQKALDDDKKQVGDWYAQQVHAVGGHTAEDLPQAAVKQLKAGFVTTFGNGTQWTLDASGKPKRIK